MITIYASKPRTLLGKIKAAIDEGHIRTWEYDSAGDLTHTATQWNEKGWLRPYTLDGKLCFGLIGQNGVVMNKDVYGTYHGHFLDTMLRHFDNDFSNATATSHRVAGYDSYAQAGDV